MYVHMYVVIVSSKPAFVKSSHIYVHIELKCSNGISQMLKLQNRSHVMVQVAPNSVLPSGLPVNVICGSLPAKLYPDELVDGYSRCMLVENLS